MLAGTAYDGWPLNSVTFDKVASLIQGATDSTGDGIIDYPGGTGLIANATLFQLDSTGAMIGRLSVLSLLVINATLDDLSASASQPIDWCALSSPYTGGACLVRDPSTGKAYPDATLFELGLYGVPSSIVPVWDIRMSVLKPLLAAHADPKSPLAYLLNGDYDGDGVVESAPICTTSVTLGGCLAEIITPQDFPWEDLPIGQLNLPQYALGERLPITAQYGLGTATATSTIAITLPTGFVYDVAAGTTACVVGTCTKISPSTIGLANPQVLTFGPSGLPTGLVQLSLFAAPKGMITGAPGQPTRTTSPVAVSFTSGTITQTASAPGPTVIDPWPANTVPTLVPDSFYFGTLVRDGINAYDVTLPSTQVGSWLSVRLTAISPGLDGDLALYAPSAAPALRSSPVLRSSAVLASSDQPVSDPGSDPLAILPPETLQDVPTAPTDIANPLLKAVAANRGSVDEMQSIVDASTTTATSYRIQVSAYGTTSGDYAVRVLATPSGISACPNKTFGGTIGAPVSVSGVAAPNGLIVYNTLTTSAALLGVNGDISAPTLFGLAKASGSWLLPVTPSAADNWATPQAGSQFDCAPVAANAVVQAIADAIKARRTGALAGVSSVVLVGGDDKLPFYRLPDTTTLSNEIEHSDQVGTDNPISASQRDRYFLSDDPYGTLNPITWLDRSFNVPDLAVGRLVESDTDIQGQIGEYLSNAGRLSPSSALVTGYDFLADGSEQVRATLAGAGLTTSALIDQPRVSTTAAWTAQAAQSALAASPGVVALNSHFSQYQLLSSKGDVTQTADLLDLVPGGSSPDLPAGILTDSVLFSAGCHGGMSVPDAYATANATYPLLAGSTSGVPYDWAQALSSRKASVWVANTGYGYGSSGDVALSERLMALYAKYLVDPATTGAGDALVKAKQDYFATQGVYGSYDEKALQQVVFYGIPMFHLSVGAASSSLTAAAAAAPSSGGLTPQAGSGGLPASASIANTAFNLTSRVADGRTAYSVDGETLVINGYPIQPKTSVDVTSTAAGFTARGATLETMQTSQVAGVVPQMARATADRSSSERAQQPATAVFPTAFQTVAGNANKQRLVIFPGQFSDLDPAPNATSGTQMLIDHGSYTVYYADSTTAGDVTKPFIQESTASVGLVGTSPGVVLFRVKALDRAGVADTRSPTGVKRVLVQYDETPSAFNTSHTWRPVELHQDTTGTWVGALVTSRTDGRYFIQAVDGAGNAGVSQFKGNYYRADGTSPQAVAVITNGTLGGGSWYVSPVQVTLYIAGAPATSVDGYTYSFDGISQGLYSVPFDVPEGATSITFAPPSTSGAAAPPALALRKDTRTPSATLTPALSVVAAGEPVPTATCVSADPVPGSGVAGCTPQTPTSITVAGQVYSLANAKATDVAGNTSTVASQTAVIVSGTRNLDGSFSAANSVTVVAGGELFNGSAFTVNGAPTAGTIDAAAKTNTLSLSVPNTYTIGVTVPGSGGTANVTVTFTVTVNDSVPPVLSLSAPGPVEASSPAGAVVTFSATAVDNIDGAVPVTCTPASGSTFALGITTVTCSAHDTAGNTSTASFTVTVRDTTAPNLTVPGNISGVEATGPGGAIVTYSATVTDIADPSPSVTCTPASGSTFALGTTTVSCTATDHSGNSTNKTFTVTVVDTTAPVFGPAPAIGPIEGNTLGGAVVGYVKPSATDTVSGAVTVTCTPASGSTFALGTTSVACTASDAKGNQATATFTVAVVDTTPPSLTVPANITKAATSAAGAIVTYTVTATDVVSGPITPVCAPASGTTFPIGTTTASCTATDGKGNGITKTFTVTVARPYRYNGFFSPVNMGVADSFGLNSIVNSVNGGRNVPFKWEAYDNATGLQVTDPARVEIEFIPYAQFLTKFSSLFGATASLPNRNVCADAGRVVVPISGGTGKTTVVKFVSGQFNEGIQVPTKPSPPAWNCYVAWTRIIGDPNPGIASLFTLT